MAVSKKKVNSKGLKKAVEKTRAKGKKKNTDESLINQMIQDRAYYIWEEKSKPIGQCQEIWLQAEKEMLTKIK